MSAGPVAHVHGFLHTGKEDPVLRSHPFSRGAVQSSVDPQTPVTRITDLLLPDQAADGGGAQLFS